MEKSPTLKAIGNSLMLFQTKMEKIKKDATNPFFKSKYATLSTILENIQLPLAESGLAFSQLPDGDCLTTILIHIESGEYLQSCYNIHPSKSDPQGIGSAITYARRYALTSILGLNVDDDDDGNAASVPAKHESNGKMQPNPKAADDELEWLNANDDAKFNAARQFIQSGGTMAQIRKKYKISKQTEQLLIAK